ncbi:ABC transporter substrate-binding protein [Brachybacterium sacelli]|uniref:Multiple sugar transport system substrate-binding protein n=1 Tax=Brachybacterium sacelli TaxID=173364 RepID=A0ABS4WW41_9MICO|nr:extracellular solute-binding protein [Brachybacterium sacelli]MBP2380183.1 multiple sugar transport system substrate-binding protein [Brachybacterium sacelli]
MNDLKRRTLLGMLGTSAVTAPLLAACGGTGGGPAGSSGDGSTLRFAYWGGAERQALYTEGIAGFIEETGIQVEEQFASYDAFQERMTTQIAGSDVPAVFWIPSAQVMTYADAGIYRTLDDVESFDLSDFEDEDIESYQLDGVLNSFPKSVFSACVRYNRTMLEEAGAELPSGENWTWDGFAEFLIDYSADNGEGRKGTTYNAYSDMALEAWMRQRGVDLWTEDGRLGAGADDFASWFDWWEKLREKGATTTISEQDGAQPDWTLTGDMVLTTFANTNHIIDEAPMFPDYEFAMAEVPASADALEGWPFLYLSRFAMYEGASDELVADAGAFMSYTVNSLDMLKIVGLSAGAPPNPRLLETAKADAGPLETKVLEITSQIRERDRGPRYEAPDGTGTWRDKVVAAIEQITLGDASIMDASQGLVDSIDAEMGSA